MENQGSSIQNNTPTSDQLVHNFGSFNTSIFTKKLIIVLIVAAIVGIGSGYAFSRGIASKQEVVNGGSVSTSDIKKGMVVGSDDTEIFKDTAEGVLKAGGIDGEGAYHLERPGGKSQNVYLTSSIVDLSKFLDLKIKVWGETQQAKFAGWLMDVGRIEVLE
ncbi:MAG: hypothetical protein ACD_50C00065G0008 [uncultured bacterium]|nr:MAG: hypothetical protein ACD_50C00065G0008 [uncultured bacterium]OGH13088.1 MAG: hypothetical protein A2687_00300 [Candidatus Levybacteria bacterium RIFCSPHIGHO2_01_FULL_38_26]